MKLYHIAKAILRIAKGSRKKIHVLMTVPLRGRGGGVKGQAIKEKKNFRTNFSNVYASMARPLREELIFRLP